MKKLLLAVSTLVAAGLACAQAPDTLRKIKDSGSVSMGVREASGGLSYALGGGKYAGFHVELCQRVLDDVQKLLGLARLEVTYQQVSPRNRIVCCRTAAWTSSAARPPTTSIASATPRSR